MARKKKEPVAERREIPAAADESYRVDEVDLEGGRALIRVYENAPAWESDLDLAALGSAVKGAIVRVDPPLDADPTRVERVRAWFEESGALAVRVSPIRRSAVLIERPAAPRAHRRAHDVVLETARATNGTPEEIARLLEFCEGVMGKVGVS